MRALFFSICFLLIGGIGFASTGEPTVKSANTKTSSIVWKGYKLMKTHQGTLKLKSGSLKFDGERLVGGEFVVDMKSLENTDLSSGSGKEKLEGHLKSEDFFAVEKYPTASIRLTKVVQRGNPNEYRVTGLVTIKNKSKEIHFNTVLNNGVATADIKLDRSDFDVRYGSGSFFDNLGDTAIYDDFDLEVIVKY
ncbi:MAG: YceI family protein [Saprospiraceae bacterium]|nr:MAG: ycei family protein [Bacteroidetes bacterium OLB9]MCO6462830.1 YceI family protein [Saprospiraceae bacterium]